MGYEWNEKMIEYGLTPSRRVAGNPSIISWASTYWKHHQQLFVAGDLQQAMYLWVPSSTSGYSSVNCSLIWIVGNMMINTGILRRSFSDCYPDQGNLSNYKWGFHQEVNGNSSLVIQPMDFTLGPWFVPKWGWILVDKNMDCPSLRLPVDALRWTVSMKIPKWKPMVRQSSGGFRSGFLSTGRFLKM